ncbi:MAG: SUMF1/EgtB/PvdO family nonheme iron enzyme [Treponema sp.]|nr:SUMF1/EgtB/PvdO family nonheme iron enzyme [Treponema sp.]
MKRYFGKSALFSLAALAAAAFLSCSGLQGDAANAALALVGTEQASGAGQGGAGSSAFAWAGVQTLSGQVLQEGIMPAEFSLAPVLDSAAAASTDSGASSDFASTDSGVSKSIFPTPPTASSLTYTVSGTATIHGEAVSASGTFDKTTNKYSIELPYESSGTEWSVTISAKSSGGSLVLSKTETITIDSRSPAATPFQLEYSTSSTVGLGTVAFDIGYDTASGVSAITVFWNNSATGTDLTLSSGSASYSKSDISPGTYDVKIVFYNGSGEPLYAIVEKALVYSNLATNKFVGTAPYISSGSVSLTATEIENFSTASAEGGIWVGGYGLVDSAEASDVNDGSKFKPVATLYRAFQIANSLAAIDSSKTYNIKIQGDVFAGTSANKNATLSGDTKVLLEGTSTSSSSYKSIKGSSGTYKIDTSSSSLTCRYLIFDYLGGFTVAGGETTMNYCKVQNGQSAVAGTAGGITVAGGASFNSTASLTITGCANTAASGGGGGIYCEGTLSLKGTTIQKCKATGTSANGGGIYVDGSGATVTLDGCTIGETSSSTASSTSLCSNHAASNGGGIYIASSSTTGVTLKNSTNVSYNYAANGGGIYAGDGKLSLASTTVQRNGTATKGCGAGIYLYKTALTFADAACAISNNTANPATYSSASGGGLYISASVTGAMTIKGTFNGNTAYNGGGIYNASTKSVTLDSTCVIGASGAGNTVGNTSSKGNGGGVYNNGTSLIVNGATIQYNGGSTASYGGGIYNNKGSLYVYGSTSISHNTVTGYGGGIYNYSTGTLKLGYDASGTATAWTGSISANEVSSDSDSSGGGGISSDGTFDMASGTIGGPSAALGNKAVKGAGLRISGGASSISGGTIQYNEATKEGGGIWTAGNLTVSATISNNSAAEKGGGIYNSGKVTVSAATFNANAADKGAGIYYKGITGMGTTLTLSGNCKIGTSSTDRLGIHLENAVSPIALSSFSKTNGKVEITPDVGGGCVIGTNLISSGVSSSAVLGYFTLPASMSDVYRLLQNSAAAKLDLQPVSQISVAGGTVTTPPYTSSTSTTYVTDGAFKSASTTPVTVRSIKMAATEVSYELWYAVYQWAIHRATNSYSFGTYGKEGVDALASTDATSPSESVPPTTTTVNSGEGRGGQRPVTFVSWRDAVVWCNAYSEYMGLTPVYYTDSTYATPLRSCTNATTYTVDTAGSQDCPYIKASTNGNTDMANCNANGARLPTEAEWEYAARGGNPTATAWNYTYAGGDTLTSIAWIKDANSLFHCVGKKNANALSLYDMTGNNTEWCHDWNNKTASTPTRVEKGGCAANESTSGNLKTENRGGSHPARFGQRSGFRFVQNN